MDETVKKVSSILDDLGKKYRQRYGAAIFDIRIEENNGSLEIGGKALLKRQKEDILNEIRKNGIAVNGEKIKIMSDPEEQTEIGWGLINAEGIVNVLGKYLLLDNLTPAGKSRFLATQLTKGDVVRILAKKDNQFLIQTIDLAIGWVEKTKVRSQNSKTELEEIKSKWSKVLRSEKDKLLEAPMPDGQKLNEFIDKYSGVPYVLGGATEKGIDCSALAQRFYGQFYGITLPRHSEDQAKCGVKVQDASSVRLGDLVFLKLKDNGHYHIGIVVGSGNAAEIKILNARRQNGGVVVQTLDEILKSYELLDIRRIVK